jgi:hypothetical protein
VAYWPLNESAASGDVTAVDNSGRGNDLTSNNTVPSVAGIQSNGRLFTAANSEFLSINSNADVQFGNGNWAISFWLYSQNTTTGYTHPVGKDASGAREWGMRLQADAAGNANRMEMYVFNTDGTFSYLTGPADRTNANYVNRWWHYVAVHNAGALTVYENGESYVTGTRTAGKTFITTSTAFNIGRRPFTGFLEYFNGRIDEVAKWSRALTATEVSQLYNAGAGIDLSQLSAASTVASPPAAAAPSLWKSETLRPSYHWST